ncbi:hypothetical protein DV704_10140 [Meiothermus sp. QL-1]|uniref:hypothetical protein n=1 Tax=Meiothermus sp. QL-1 TaxID=2058095 RepID=UPI000E0CB1E0|nr:hypothetical protein [Meiothermus sp. QL-1]RDI94824.1 hypothetical protein DV704_10140 [Meiothermus sp. QL-1]
MKRLVVFFLLIAAIASLGLAQRAFQLRVSVPSPSLGLGLEAGLQRDLVGLIYGDLVFSGPGVLLGGEVLFKPDLGQFDRGLRGIRPYFGGGLGVKVPSAEFLLSLSAGVEFALDRDTGLFIGGQSLFPFTGSPSSGRLLIGAVLR